MSARLSIRLVLFISELKGKVITNIRAYGNSPFASGLSSGGFR
jgi:hypothetical protein